MHTLVASMLVIIAGIIYSPWGIEPITIYTKHNEVDNVYTNETLIFARDEYENCSLWAGRIGECESEFMLMKCRRSCDIQLVAISNPFMKAQREWYDDLRDEYLDHSTPDNVLRNEALFKMLFLHKMNDLIEEYDKEEDEDYLNMVIESMYGLLNNDERLSFDREVTLLHETFRAIGGEDFINPYNLMAYYLNIAEGTEHEYVSSTIVHSNPGLFNKFSTSNDNNISLVYEKLTSKPHPDLDDSWKWTDDAKVKFLETVGFTILGIIALTFLVLCLAAYDLPKPIKRRKISIKPKNAKKKEKYYYLLTFAHHVYAMLLDTSLKLCGMIWKTPSLLSVASLAAYDSVTDAFRSTANVSFEFIQHLFSSICSILRRGIQCLVVIPRMISIGIGMLIRLPSKLIRETVGTEHVSIDQPSNSSPQRSEAPQLVMSPSSAVSVIAVDEQKVKSMVEQNDIRKLELEEESSTGEFTQPEATVEQEDVPPEIESPPTTTEVPSEIGIDSSQVLTCETTEISISSFNHRSNTSMTLSTFELDENDPLLIFLRSQQSCIKGNVDEFYIWLVKYENIESMMALKEAVSDDDYLNDTMRIGDRSYGVKGFKLKAFRCAILEYEHNKTVQRESKASSATSEPPEELVCPISLHLMTNDPVVAADGITYERASIEDWFKKSKAKISEAQTNLENSPHSEADQRVINNGICSPVYGTKCDNLVLVPHIGTRNMARAYNEKKKEVH